MDTNLYDTIESLFVNYKDLTFYEGEEIDDNPELNAAVLNLLVEYKEEAVQFFETIIREQRPGFSNVTSYFMVSLAANATLDTEDHIFDFLHRMLDFSSNLYILEGASFGLLVLIKNNPFLDYQNALKSLKESRKRISSVTMLESLDSIIEELSIVNNQ